MDSLSLHYDALILILVTIAATEQLCALCGDQAYRNIPGRRQESKGGNKGMDGGNETGTTRKLTEEDMKYFMPKRQIAPDERLMDPNGAAQTEEFTTEPPPTRRTPYRILLKEECDYLAYFCLRAYKTGEVCARTTYYTRKTFENYCMMDYANCMQRYIVWMIAYMGPCNEKKLYIKDNEYVQVEMFNYDFLNDFYVVSDSHDML